MRESAIKTVITIQNRPAPRLRYRMSGKAHFYFDAVRARRRFKAPSLADGMFHIKAARYR